MRTIVIALASAGLLLGGVAVVPGAVAAPSRDIQQVRDQVRTLQAQAEAATERYNEARTRLNAVQSDLSALKAKASRERDQLQQVMSSVDDLARATYTSGGVDTSLQILLADDPTEFLAQAAALDQVAQSQAASIRRTQTARLRLAQSEAAVRDKEDIAQNYRDNMADAKEEADDRLNEAEGVLAGLEADERRRLAALAEQERQAGNAAAAAAIAALGNGASSAGGGVPRGQRPRCRRRAVRALAGR